MTLFSFLSLRVAEKEPINKMSLHNLATVFGPTLLRPSEVESKAHLTSAADIWSHDVMAQVLPALCRPVDSSEAPAPLLGSYISGLEDAQALGYRASSLLKAR